MGAVCGDRRRINTPNATPKESHQVSAFASLNECSGAYEGWLGGAVRLEAKDVQHRIVELAEGGHVLDALGHAVESIGAFGSARALEEQKRIGLHESVANLQPNKVQ